MGGRRSWIALVAAGALGAGVAACGTDANRTAHDVTTHAGTVVWKSTTQTTVSGDRAARSPMVGGATSTDGTTGGAEPTTPTSTVDVSDAGGPVAPGDTTPTTTVPTGGAAAGDGSTITTPPEATGGGEAPDTP